MESIDVFIDRLPKVELHLHLVGSASVPHAGEMSGPATIWEALTGLRAERIGHGISRLDDPALVAWLRESQIPLEVCPTSNVCTRQVPDLAAHPLPRLLAEGLFVTLYSDDPPMFGTTLTQEYRRAASALGLDRAQLAALAANGVRASFLDSAAKQALVQEIEAVAAGSFTGALPATAARRSHSVWVWFALVGIPLSLHTGTDGRGHPSRQERETMTSGRPGAAPQDWLLRLLPLALLIILGLAGLRGVVATPRWNGPLHRDGLVIGLALEVVLGTLLVITIGRRSAGRDAQMAGPAVNPVAVKLRGVLIFVLSAGMIAVAATIFFGLHLHLFTVKPSKPIIRHTATATPKVTVPPLGSVRGSTFHIPVAALLYALLVVVLLAGVVLSILWARRLRPSIAPREDDFIAEDSEDLREAVESGRSALRTADDARAAIIACYVAMESSLAERGAARGIADTPDELLARAKETGIVRGAAAARLTALFYEARFSSHPLDHRQRGAAEQALDELAAALAETEAAKAELAGAGQAGTGPAGAGGADA